MPITLIENAHVWFARLDRHGDESGKHWCMIAAALP